MEFKLVSEDKVALRLQLVGRLTHDGLLPDLTSLEQCLGPGTYHRNVLLSLAEIISIDSVRLGWLAVVHNRVSESGGTLVVHSARPEVMEVLETARFEFLFHIAEDEAAALKMLGQEH